MKMSDVIADFIGEMLSSGGGVAEVQRKSLADRFSCVPSQINYVIETRFTPEHGYLVESQRGGGGYIRIVRLMDDKQRTLLEAARGIGGRLTQKDKDLLASCYRSCLELADENGCRSIAFCCISTGEFHFPNDKAAEIAIRTVKEYKAQTQSKTEVVFNVFKEYDYNIYRELLE